jgi:hypothetical protein
LKKLEIANNGLPDKYAEMTDTSEILAHVRSQTEGEIPQEYRQKIAALKTQKRGVFRDTLTLVKELRVVLDDPMGTYHLQSRHPASRHCTQALKPSSPQALHHSITPAVRQSASPPVRLHYPAIRYLDSGPAIS